MTAVKDRIGALSTEQAIEAAQFLCDALVGPDAESDAARTAVGSIADAPYQNLQAVDELARLVLAAAADMPEYAPAVEKAIDAAGRKNVVLGGAEIVALSIVGLLALDLIVRKGVAEEKSSEIVEVDPKTGKKTVRTSKHVKYGLSNTLSGVLTKFFGK